jgi:betaine-aldehyde dehydrogenase
MAQGGLFIDGRWSDLTDGGRIEVLNPANEESLGSVAAGGGTDIGRAVAAAERARRGWASLSGRERGTFLRAIGQRIAERREDLARMEVLDNGKPLPEALWDIDDAAGCFDFYAGLAEELDAWQNAPVALPDARFTSRVRHEPCGVAGLIIPWNYPLLMAAWKVAPALAAGATCVLKPSELTPLTALELGAIAIEVGLPPGVLNIVTGTGPAAGRPLATHPRVRKVAFTGSVPTGSAIMSGAAQDIKNVSLELGGKSPIVVFADAEIEAAVEWILFGIFWNQGQVCSATSRLIVEESLAPRLLERLVAEAQRITIGNGLDAGTLLGPLVSEGQLQKVSGLVATARSEGAKLLCGGSRPEACEKGYFFEPTILMEPEGGETIAWREEIFGPVLSVRTFREEAEAIELSNGSRFGLAAAVMSTDPARCDRVAEAFEAGIVWINCSQPTFTQAPWGGVKSSGIGRELGEWGLRNYLEAKQITTYRSPDPWGWYLKS